MLVHPNSGSTSLETRFSRTLDFLTTSGDGGFRIRRWGDADARIKLEGSNITFGDGTNAPDAVIGHGGANIVTLGTGDALYLVGPLKHRAFQTLSDDATPPVSAGNMFITGGTTTITDFDDGLEGQVITIIAEHNITITDGTNIILIDSSNFDMVAPDSLVLVLKADNKWYELSRTNTS